MIFLGVLFFFYFSLRFFAPRCPVRATYAGALPLSSWFYVEWHPMPQKRQRISRCLSYVHSAGLYPALTLSFAAESYSALYSLYAPLIYVRLYFTSCPVTVYTFSPRRMRIWPSMRTLRIALDVSTGISSMPCISHFITVTPMLLPVVLLSS